MQRNGPQIVVKVLLIDGDILKRWTPALESYHWKDTYTLGLKLEEENLMAEERNRSRITYYLHRDLHLEEGSKSPYFRCNISSPTEEITVEGRIEKPDLGKELLKLDVDNVVHYEKKRKFCLRLSPIESRRLLFGSLHYEVLEDGSRVLYHTEIPPRFRGSGLGKVLAKRAVLEFGDRSIRLTCDYLIHLYSNYRYEVFNDKTVV